MNTITVSAKSVEKAIEEGLLLLNTTIENVDVNIISEGGFFKKAVVELTLTEEALQEKENKLKRIEELEKKQSNTKKPKEEKVTTLEIGEDATINEEILKMEKELEKLTKANEQVEDKNEEKLSVEDEIKNFLNGLIYAFNVNATTEVKLSDEGDYLVEIVGDNLGVFIGYRGEALNAIQFLLNNYIFNKTGYRKLILLDIENYRAKRVDVLKGMASNLANKVIKTKKRHKLEPMNKFERKIIHAHLQDVKNIETHSEGKDPYRYLVISYVE